MNEMEKRTKGKRREQVKKKRANKEKKKASKEKGGKRENKPLGKKSMRINQSTKRDFQEENTRTKYDQLIL